MKALKNFTLVVLLMATTAFTSEASHYMGGEISWKCLPNGNFRFILKVYRECAGIAYPNSITLNSNSPAGSIQMNLYPNTTAARSDLSPDCNPDPMFTHIECATTPFGSAYSNTGAVEQWYYTSDQAYPNGVMLNGIPPPTGWIFSYSSCCRNPCTNINGSSSMNWFLRAIMYPYNNTSAYPCWDNSPVFAQEPFPVICTGYPITYSYKAYDAENDSLAYEWAPPLLANNQPVAPGSYASGYSYSSPLPGTFHNPNNVPAILDTHEGIVSVTSYTSGAFVAVAKVTAFKNHIKVAEVFRELQVVMLSCGNNLPPYLSFGTNVPTSGNLVVDTVQAGSHVNVLITGTDSFPLFLPNGQLQTLTLNAYGPHFGTTFTSDSTGCMMPPCATLNPPPPVTNQFGVTTALDWDVTMDHFIGDTNNLVSQLNHYDFIFSIRDDFCPAPGIKNYTYRLYVDCDIVTFPSWACINSDLQGDVSICWMKAIDHDSAFEGYILSYSLSSSGPFIPLDTLTDINQNNYQHQGACAQGQVIWYKLAVMFKVSGKLFTINALSIHTSQINAPEEVCMHEIFSASLEGMVNTEDSISWDFGQLTVLGGSGTGPYTITANAPGTYHIVFEKYDSCGFTLLDKEIQVNPLPSISISGPRYFCPGQPVILNASGGTAYQWNTGSSSSTISLSLTAPQCYFLTVTDSNLCVDTASICIREIQTYQNTRICLITCDHSSKRLQVIWEKPSTRDIKEYLIHWHDASQPAAWNTLGTVGFDNAGIYTDTQHLPDTTQHYYALQVVDSCNEVSVMSPPAASLYLKANKFGNDVILSWLPYIGNDSDFYVHLYRYDNVSGVFSLMDSVAKNFMNYTDISPPSGSKIYYAAIPGFFCEPVPGTLYTAAYSNLVMVDNSSGLSDLQDQAVVSIRQDIANRCLYIEWRNHKFPLTEIILFDALGRRVLSSIPENGSDTHRIDLSTFSRGIYFYIVRGEEHILVTGKFMH